MSAGTRDLGSAARIGLRKSRIDAFAHLVGQYPDRVVAEKAGVSLNAVRNWRMRHGVPPSGRIATDGMLSDSQLLPEIPNGAGAWKVLANGMVKVVVAPSLAEAAARAQSAGLGTILALEWIGELL